MNKYPSSSFLVRKNGFSLLELLVVLLIIGIIVSFVVLRVGDFGQSRKIEATMNQLVALIKLSQQQALLTSTPIKIAIDDQGFVFSHYRDHKWQAIKTDPLLKSYHWPIAITLQANQGQSQSTIFISNTGSISPFSFTFHFHQHAWHLYANAQSQIKLSQLNHE